MYPPQNSPCREIYIIISLSHLVLLTTFKGRFHCFYSHCTNVGEVAQRRIGLTEIT